MNQDKKMNNEAEPAATAQENASYPQLFSSQDALRAKSVRRKERVVTIITVCILCFALLISCYYYLGDPLHILGVIPHSYEQGLTEEALPLGHVDIYVLPLGDADCTVLLHSNGTAMVIDAGDTAHSDTILGFLNAKGISRIETLVLSNPNDAHTGAMLDILRTYPVGSFVSSAVSSDSDTYRQISEYVLSNGIPWQKVNILPSDTGPTEIPWAKDTSVIALSPFSGDYSSPKDYSLILRVKFGDTAMIFSGDATSTAERISVKMLKNKNFTANIIMLGNHGDSGSSCEKFLSATKASIAVVSCSSSGPSSAVLTRLKKAKMSLLRTDVEGIIHLRLDGSNASVVE